MSHLWSGRFDTAPDAAAFDFGASFRFDRRLFEDDVHRQPRVGRRAARRRRAVARRMRDAIEAALTEILERGRADPAFVDGPGRRRAQLRRAAAGRAHRRRRPPAAHRPSRNEQVSLDLRLYLRRRIPCCSAASRRVVGALADQAERCGDALMPSYTHLRRAQPVLVAHFLLAHAAALRRDHARLGAAAARSRRAAARVGRDRRHQLRDRHRRARARARLLARRRQQHRRLVGSRLRRDVPVRLRADDGAPEPAGGGPDHLQRRGARVLRAVRRASTGSSMMPQKKNPDPLELVRGKTGRAIGHLAGWLTTMKGLPSGYNKDLQEDKEAVFDAEETLAGSLEAVGGRRRRADPQPRARRAGGDRLAACDRRRRLPRGAGSAVPARARSRRRADAPAARRGPRLRVAEPGRVAGLQRAVRGRHRAAVTAAASVAARRTPQSTRPRRCRRRSASCARGCARPFA